MMMWIVSVWLAELMLFESGFVVSCDCAVIDDGVLLELNLIGFALAVRVRGH